MGERRQSPASPTACADTARVNESRVVPDAGHASNVDTPAFFTAAVREFAAPVFAAD